MTTEWGLLLNISTFPKKVTPKDHPRHNVRDTLSTGAIFKPHSNVCRFEDRVWACDPVTLQDIQLQDLHCDLLHIPFDRNAKMNIRVLQQNP